MMENLKGIDSPMFDYIEQTAGKEKPKELTEIKRERSHFEDNQIVEVIEDEKEEIIAFDEKEDFRQYLRDNYDKTEFEIAKSTIMILEDMSKNAKHINDLRSEVVKDIYTTCRISRIRIAKIIEVRSFANKLSDMDALLEVVDFLDKKLDAFRDKYNRLKAKEQKHEEQRQQERRKEQEREQEEEQEQEEEEEELEIGNIDLLDLGLGDDQDCKGIYADKDKQDTQHKVEHKKEGKQKEKEKEKEKIKEKEKEDGKHIRKLIAPPSGARKLNTMNERKSDVVEKEDKEVNEVNLIDFN